MPARPRGSLAAGGALEPASLAPLLPRRASASPSLFNELFSFNITVMSSACVSNCKSWQGGVVPL